MSLDSDLTQGERALGRMTRATERALIAAYSRALKDIRAILAGYHERYGAAGVLTYIEMAKYNRLRSLEAAVAAELKALGRDVGRLTTGASRDTYSESYLRTAYALEREAQAKLGWTVLNPKTIEASVQNPISGMKLSERLAGNRTAVVTKIRSELTQGLIRGEGYGDMARRIKKVLDGDATKAIRVAQTEAHRVMQEGRLASMQFAEARGVRQQKTWVATLDERTREDHQALDGQTVPVDGYFEINGMRAKAPGGFGVPELDINCRCSMRTAIEGYEPTVRRARGEGVIPYQTYPEWMAAKGMAAGYKGPMPAPLSFVPAADLAAAMKFAAMNYAAIELPGVTLQRLNEINHATSVTRKGLSVMTDELGFVPPGLPYAGRSISSRLDGRSLRVEFAEGVLQDPAAYRRMVRTSFYADRHKGLRKIDLRLASPGLPAAERLRLEIARRLVGMTKRYDYATSVPAEKLVYALAAHENGHAVYGAYRLHSPWVAACRTFAPEDILGVSDYCRVGPQELFAEVTAAFAVGRESDIPPSIARAFRDIMKRIRGGTP